MLRNAVMGVYGGGGVYGSVHVSVKKVYSPTLSALRGGGGVKIPDKSVT